MDETENETMQDVYQLIPCFEKNSPRENDNAHDRVIKRPQELLGTY